MLRNMKKPNRSLLCIHGLSSHQLNSFLLAILCCAGHVFGQQKYDYEERSRSADDTPRPTIINNGETRLYNHWFHEKRVNSLVRPVLNLSEPSDVILGATIVQLINVDEKNQIMKTNGWLRVYWVDYQLAWNPDEFAGITEIRVPPEKVWKPDIVLFNNADGNYDVSFKSNVVVNYTGWCLWVPPFMYKSSCTIDVEYFPFDEQKCDMKFGSWTYNGHQVTLDYEEGPYLAMGDYVPSGSWHIIDYPANYTTCVGKDDDCTAFMTYSIKIRRKTLFYTVNLIIPCVLISILGVFVFFLPADAGEKMTMCISILLALVVFLLLVSKILPPTSMSVPLIAKYLLFAFIMDIISIVITVIVLNWNFRTPRTHRMTGWVRKAFLHYLPKLLLMKRPDHMEKNDKPKPHESHTGNFVRSHNVSMDTSASSGSADHEGFHHPRHHVNANRRPANAADAHAHQNFQSFQEEGHHENYHYVSSEMHKAIEAVRFIAAHLKNEDDYGEILDDWRYIAMVIDRLMLCIFLAAVTAGTVGILINAPHIYKKIS